MDLLNRVKENIAYFRRMLDKLFPGKCRFFYWADMLWCALRHGCTPKNYIWFDFYRFNDRERSRFMTDARVNRFYKRNNTGDTSVLDDKVSFNRRFSNYVRRPWLELSSAAPDELAGLTEICGKVVLKPRAGSWGDGFEVIGRTCVKDCGAIIAEHKDCIAEGYISQHEALVALNPSCVNSIRVITYVCSDGIARIAAAALRIGAAGSSVDNVSRGGYCCEIDVNSGIVTTTAVNREQDRFAVSPFTGKKLIGMEIPHWNDIRHAARAAAGSLEDIRFVGWDIAVTDDGFEFIEGNSQTNLGVLQMAAKVGRRDIEAAAMKDDLK